MIEIDIQEMMETGAHFGHQTKRWNPKMRPYIYGARSGVHILDLQKTKYLGNEALKFLQSVVASGQKILFVGTKVQSRQVVKEQAERSGMHYVNNRWMGGTLTNFKTIKKSIDQLIQFETRRENNDFKGFKKKELLEIDRKIIKLEASLGGIKTLSDKPGALFVIDPSHEKIAIKEARKLNIPIVALVDSNCDPDPIDYLIPANDDAIASIIYFTVKVAEACLEGGKDKEKIAQFESQRISAQKKPDKKRRVSNAPETTDKKSAFVDKSVREQRAAEGDTATDSYSVKVDKKASKDDHKIVDDKKEITRAAATG